LQNSNKGNKKKKKKDDDNDDDEMMSMIMMMTMVKTNLLMREKTKYDRKKIIKILLEIKKLVLSANIRGSSDVHLDVH
jgi:hypothetical protein